MRIGRVVDVLALLFAVATLWLVFSALSRQRQQKDRDDDWENDYGDYADYGY